MSVHDSLLQVYPLVQKTLSRAVMEILEEETHVAVGGNDEVQTLLENRIKKEGESQS